MLPGKPAKPVELRSEGQRLLRLTGLSIRNIAAKIGVSRSSVDRYLRGEPIADTDVKVRIENKLLIPVLSWDAAPKVYVQSPSQPSQGPSRPHETSDSLSQSGCPDSSQGEDAPIETDDPNSLEAAKAHRERCRRWRQAAEAGKSITAIAKAAELERKSIEFIAKLTGEFKPSDEAKRTLRLASCASKTA